MLAYLRGTIQSKVATTLVLDVNGIGFEVLVSAHTLTTIGEVGDTVEIPTSLSIRETDWTIFGFASIEERDLFLLLKTVSGVGPKLALSVVGTLGAQSLVDGIINENHKLISQAPGVGAKVAQRIVLELKNKVDVLSEYKFDEKRSGQTQIAEEVRIILAGLGYTTTEIGMALTRAREEDLGDDVESLVKYSLKVLGSSAVS